MAEIIQDEGGKKKGKGHGAKKHSTHIDMTPMVDLACLLITFFMLTTAFSKPKVMEIVLPEKNNNPDEKPKDQPQVAKARTLHILISEKDQVYYYVGLADPNKPPLPELVKSDFSKDGIRKILLEKNIELYKKVDEITLKVVKGDVKISPDSLKAIIKDLKKQDKVGPIVLIKADDKAKYKSMVNVIDEMAITNIARYAIVDISPVEIEMLKNAPK